MQKFLKGSPHTPTPPHAAAKTQYSQKYKIIF